jgi:hypothetical protein
MKKWMLLVLVPFLVGMASALPLTASIEMDDLVYMPGELVTATVHVENIAEDKVYFLDHWVDDYYILNARVLRQGDNTINLFFDAPEVPGFHKIKVKIYDNKGYSITKEKEFAVSPLNKGFLIELVPKVTITDSKAQMTLKIANSGTYDDLFEVLLPDYYAKSNHSYVEVKSQGMEYFNIEADFSDYKSNNYNFPVKVCSLYLWSCLSNSADILVKREEAEETVVGLSGEDFTVYPDQNVVLNVYLNNTSYFNKSYSLELEPVEFSGEYAKTSLLSLEGDELGTIRTMIRPNSTGDYSFNYTLLSNGVEILSGTLNITAVENPFSMAAVLSPKYGWVYALVALVIVLVVSYFFVKQRGQEFKYPYIK